MGVGIRRRWGEGAGEGEGGSIKSQQKENHKQFTREF